MKKRVLIIEDNGKNRMLEKDLLEVAGLEVLEAATGAHGISLAKQERPHAIVLDLWLPDMRGDRVAQRLRQEAETCDTPIIFVTASVVGDLIVDAREIPNSTLMTKPIDTRTFAKQILERIPGGLHG